MNKVMLKIIKKELRHLGCDEVLCDKDNNSRNSRQLLASSASTLVDVGGASSDLRVFFKVDAEVRPHGLKLDAHVGSLGIPHDYLIHLEN